MTTPDLAALLAQCREAYAKMTPGEQWGVNRRGDTITRGDSPDRMNRHPQTHLQMVPPEDAAGVVTLVNAFPQLADEIDRLRAGYQAVVDECDRVVGELEAVVAQQREALQLAVTTIENAALHLWLRHKCDLLKLMEDSGLTQIRAALALTETKK